jgi:trehalose 6-phosphate synthase/phosphatase
MNQYTDFFVNTTVKEKESMLIWDYRQTDPTFGADAADELHQTIEKFFYGFPIAIIKSKSQLKVQPHQLEKKRLVKTLLKQASQQEPLDFVMYIGGNESGPHEDVYRYLLRKANSETSPRSKGVQIKRNTTIYTCAIGREETTANFYLKDV